jgi:hypothetical protein
MKVGNLHFLAFYTHLSIKNCLRKFSSLIGVKSLISDVKWIEHGFISKDNPQLF